MSHPRFPGPVPRRRRWQRAVLTVLAVAALCGLATVLPPVISGGLAGALLGTWLHRRRLGGRQRLREYARALRTGRLPDGADPAVWRPLLEREVRSRRWALVLVVPVTGVFLMSAMLVLARAFGGGAVGWLLVAVGSVLVVVAMWGVVRAQIPQVERLLDELPERGVNTPAV